MSAIASAFVSPSAVIGKTIVIKGDVQSQEPLTIEGQVEGTIEIGDHLLTVAAGANVRGQIAGRDVEVRGRVEGEVDAAGTVFVRKDAEFVGDIHAMSLVIEDGSYIKGNIELKRKSFDSSKEPAVSADSRLGVDELSHAVLES